MLSLVEILAPIGIVQIVKYSSLFGDIIPLRETARKFPFYKNLVDCSLCLGFWAGVSVHLILNYSFLVFCIIAVGLVLGPLMGAAHGAKKCREFAGYAVFGVMLVGVPSVLYCPFAIDGVSAKEYFSNILLVGLCASPICYTTDLVITALEQRCK